MRKITVPIFVKVRHFAKDELAFKIMLPRHDTGATCPQELDADEVCGMRLADTAGIEGPVCASCKILYRFVGYRNIPAQEQSLTQQPQRGTRG